MTGKRSRQEYEELNGMEQELLQYKKDVLDSIFNDFDLDRLIKMINFLDNVDHLLNDIDDYIFNV